jgi:hypothetical protein
MIKRKIKKPMEAVIISKLIGSCREDMDRKIEIFSTTKIRHDLL